MSTKIEKRTMRILIDIFEVKVNIYEILGVKKFIEDLLMGHKHEKVDPKSAPIY